MFSREASLFEKQSPAPAVLYPVTKATPSESDLFIHASICCKQLNTLLVDRNYTCTTCVVGLSHLRRTYASQTTCQCKIMIFSEKDRHPSAFVLLTATGWGVALQKQALFWGGNLCDEYVTPKILLIGSLFTNKYWGSVLTDPVFVPPP